MGATDDLARILRLVDRLAADRRRVTRSLIRCHPGSDLAADLAQQALELDAQLARWRGIVARAEAGGVKVWSRDDFRRGDFVLYRGAWYEVLRVNARSVTIPHILSGAGRDVVRRCDGPEGLTWTVGYHDGIAGRMSAGEMNKRNRGA